MPAAPTTADLFRWVAYAQENAQKLFGHFQGEAASRRWLGELDLVLIDLYGDDGDDPRLTEKAIMQATESVIFHFLVSKGRAQKGGAGRFVGGGDPQVAAAIDLDHASDTVLAGELGLLDFENTNSRSMVANDVARKLRRQNNYHPEGGGPDLDPYRDARVDYSEPLHPVFEAIAANDLEALAALKTETRATTAKRLDAIEARLDKLESEE